MERENQINMNSDDGLSGKPVELKKNDVESVRLNGTPMNQQPLQNGQQPNQYGQYNQQPNQYGQYNQQPNQYGQYNQQSNQYGQYNQQSNQYGQYNQQPNPYGQPYPFIQPKQTSGYSIASIIFGIISIICCCTTLLAGILAIAGIVCGIIGIKKDQGGKGMAIAGLITSGVGILLSAIWFFVLISDVMEEVSQGYYFSY